MAIQDTEHNSPESPLVIATKSCKQLGREQEIAEKSSSFPFSRLKGARCDSDIEIFLPACLLEKSTFSDTKILKFWLMKWKTNVPNFVQTEIFHFPVIKIFLKQIHLGLNRTRSCHNKPNRPKPAQTSDICARALQSGKGKTLTFLCYCLTFLQFPSFEVAMFHFCLLNHGEKAQVTVIGPLTSSTIICQPQTTGKNFWH